MDYSFAKIDKNDFTTKFLPYIPKWFRFSVFLLHFII